MGVGGQCELFLICVVVGAIAIQALPYLCGETTFCFPFFESGQLFFIILGQQTEGPLHESRGLSMPLGLELTIILFNEINCTLNAFLSVFKVLITF